MATSDSEFNSDLLLAHKLPETRYTYNERFASSLFVFLSLLLCLCVNEEENDRKSKEIRKFENF
jgi:hypothetical protein